MNHVFDSIPQFARNIVIYRHLRGIDNAHIHACLNGVVEEDAVNGFPYRIIATERERYIGNTAGNVGVWQMLAYPTGGFNEIDCVVIVFIDTGRHCENIRVKDNVFGWEPHLFGQNLISTRTDFDFACLCIRLTLFIKSHHNDCSTITAYQFGLLDEFFLAFFHGNGVNNAFALNAFQTRFNDFPFGRVNHNRHARNVGFGGN